MTSLNNSSRLYRLLNTSRENSNDLAATFGVVFFTIHLLFYVILTKSSPNDFSSLTMSLIASALCVPLMFNRYCFKAAVHGLTIYWFFAACFCLPFYSSIMLLANNGSVPWLMSIIAASILVMLVFDLMIAVAVLAVGYTAGYFAFSLFATTAFDFNPGVISMTTFANICVITLVITGIFLYRKQKIAKINQQKLQAAEAGNRLKSEFITNMSHDIRTPISGVLGMVQDMLNVANDVSSTCKASDAELQLATLIKTVKKNGEFLMTATDELLQLCNDFLEVSRLESQQSMEKVEVFELHELVHHNIKLLQPVASHKKITLSTDIDASVPKYLCGIRIYLDRVILNLLSNALKFTAQGSVTIKILLFASKKSTYQVGDEIQLQIIVEDTGMGIPKEKFETIFEHFSQLTPRNDGIYHGSGLGLYTVKRYIIAMNGDIQLESEVGKGTRFILTMPFIISDQTEKPAEAELFFQPVKSTADDQDDLIAASILIVEDNLPARMAISAQLEPLNCTVDVADSGATAIEKACSNRYHLILMDLGLSDMTGLEVTKIIRAFSDPLKANVPIIALTGYTDAEKRNEAIMAGMQEMICKPASASILKAVLQQFAIADKQFAVIDWPASVTMCGGDHAFTHEMFSMLSNDLKRAQKNLEAAYVVEDMDALQAELLRVLGGVCYVKVPQLEHDIKALHQADKTDINNIRAMYQNLQAAITAFWSAWEMNQQAVGEVH